MSDPSPALTAPGRPVRKSKLRNGAKALFRWMRHNVIFTAALALALLSFAVSPPKDRQAAALWRSIKWQTPILFFCIMYAIAGLRSCHFFRVLAQRLLERRHHTRSLACTLVFLAYAMAIVATNDVALLVLVPFTILLFDMLGLRRRIPTLLALQTIAANLGAMSSPVGNPPNLYLYTEFNLSPLDFFWHMSPISLGGALLLFLLVFLLPNEPIARLDLPAQRMVRPRRAALYAVLLLLCLLSVFKVFHYGLLLALCLLCAFFVGRHILAKVHYSLLGTFVCFFIFSHNIRAFKPLGNFLEPLLKEHAQSTALVLTQVISDIPAVLLLRPFTEDWRGLYWGIDIGIFGTPIASLAALITLNFYLQEKDASGGRFLLRFLFFNLLFMGGLSLLTLFFPPCPW